MLASRRGCLVLLVILFSSAFAFQASTVFRLIENADQLARQLFLPFVSLVLCFLAARRYLLIQQYKKLPGIKSTFGLNGFLRAMLSNGQRCASLSVAAQELIASFPMMRFEGDDGDLYGGFIGPVPVVLVSSPDAIRQVLHHKHSQQKGPYYNTIREALGNGLVTAWGHRWAAHRKLLTPAFHFKILESLMSIVIPQSKVLISQLEREASSKRDRSIENLSSHIFDTTLDVLCQSSMGIESTSEFKTEHMKTALTRAFEMFGVISLTPWMWIKPLFRVTSFGREFNGYTALAHNFADKVIAARMSLLKQRIAGDTTVSDAQMGFSSKVRDPFMDIMIHEHFRDSKSFTVQDIRDETNIFLIAGRDTTGWSMIYTLFLLGHHPHVQDKLYREIEEYFKDNKFEDLTPEKIKKFTYLDSVYKESLRLYTPIPIITRLAEEEMEINGKVIPKGSEILITFGQMHRNPKYWPDPHRFKPERFSSPPADPYTFLPFAAGPRNCIGQKYAKIQAKSIIISVVRQYRIESVTQIDQVTTFFAPVQHTPEPIKLRLHPREVNNNI